MSLLMTSVEEIIKQEIPYNEEKLPLELVKLLDHYKFKCRECKHIYFRGLNFPTTISKSYLEKYASNELCNYCYHYISGNGCEYCGDYGSLRYSKYRCNLAGACKSCHEFFVEYDQEKMFAGIMDREFAVGDTEIWYLDGRKQNKFLDADTITRSDIEDSYHLLGKVACVDPSHICSVLDLREEYTMNMNELYIEFTKSIMHYHKHMTRGDLVIIGETVYMYMYLNGNTHKAIWKELTIVNDHKRQRLQ